VEGRPWPDRGPAGRRRGVRGRDGQLRQLNSEVLAVAEELSHGTIETVLAKSDLELGIEALARGLQGT
jgi:hypothetical protein